MNCYLCTTSFLLFVTIAWQAPAQVSPIIHHQPGITGHFKSFREQPLLFMENKGQVKDGTGGTRKGILMT